MVEEKSKTDGYIAAKRFLRDYPQWLLILKASVIEAERTKGEFAGAWVLEEAKKMGVGWFPNLRPLVSSGILERTGIARGGRRAYYLMRDVEGVKEAVRELQTAALTPERIKIVEENHGR